MANLVGVLSTASGLSKDKIHNIYLDVVANNRRLNSCKGPHVFVDTFDRPFDSMYKCSLCEGTLREHDVRWYELGLRHAREEAQI